MRAGRSPSDELGIGDEAVAEGDFLDDIGIVARATEPLVDHVDEADMVAAIEPGMDEVGPIDVEDHEPVGSASRVEGVDVLALCHEQIMTRGCYAVVGQCTSPQVSPTHDVPFVLVRGIGSVQLRDQTFGLSLLSKVAIASHHVRR